MSSERCTLGCLCLALLPTATCAQEIVLSDRDAKAEAQYTSYAYAHEFGSGVYSFGGRTLQVYRLPFARRLRHASSGRPGIALKMPLTLGFVDFKPLDVDESGLPQKIDSLSFVPGLEFEIPLNERWRLRPYAKAGVSFADASEVDSVLFGAGIVAEYVFELAGARGTARSDLIYSRVDYRDQLGDDDFVRLRNGAELARGTGYSISGYELEAGGFAVLDLYPDPPEGPVSGAGVANAQFELGMMLGTRPGLRVWRLPVPRIGLSYRFAGDLSAVRIVFGTPF